MQFQKNFIRVWNSQKPSKFSDTRWLCEHEISCVAVEGYEILIGTLTGSLWSLQMIAGSNPEPNEILAKKDAGAAITQVRLLNETTIVIFQRSGIHKVRRKTKQNPQKAITPCRDCFYLDFFNAQKQWLGISEFVVLDVSFPGYVFLGNTKGTTLLGNLMTRDLQPIAKNFLSACFCSYRRRK